MGPQESRHPHQRRDWGRRRNPAQPHEATGSRIAACGLDVPPVPLTTGRAKPCHPAGRASASLISRRPRPRRAPPSPVPQQVSKITFGDLGDTLADADLVHRLDLVYKFDLDSSGPVTNFWGESPSAAERRVAAEGQSQILRRAYLRRTPPGMNHSTRTGGQGAALNTGRAADRRGISGAINHGDERSLTVTRRNPAPQVRRHNSPDGTDSQADSSLLQLHDGRTTESEMPLANADIERAGIEYVMRLEREAGRHPEDVHLQGFPYDVSSPPRMIEIKAFGGSARGAPIPLEDRQVKAARAGSGKLLRPCRGQYYRRRSGQNRRQGAAWSGPSRNARSGGTAYYLLANPPHLGLRPDRQGS